MMPFITTINQPGFLPDSDIDLPVFDTVEEAWTYLMDERKQFEEDSEELSELVEYTHVVNAIRIAGYDMLTVDERITSLMELWLAASTEFTYQLNEDGTGTIIGVQTFDPESHLLPYVYSVTAVTEDEVR